MKTNIYFNNYDAYNMLKMNILVFTAKVKKTTTAFFKAHPMWAYSLSSKEQSYFICLLFLMEMYFSVHFSCFLLKCKIYKQKKQRNKMVKLSFKVRINCQLSQVWEYYSNFENIVDWDPNTTYCKQIKSTPNQIGSQFLLKSIFNGNQSTLIYTIYNIQSNEKQCKIQLLGLNQNVQCYDQITFIAQGNQTLMDYKADICLRGIKVLFTPFIVSSLDKIAEDCRKGVIKVNTERWGTAQ